MKPQLIILSDLWGKHNNQWLSYYQTALSNHFDITYYDCCDLGNIDTSTYRQDDLHHQFVTGGIQTAVNALSQQIEHVTCILGFSIGGTIAWQFALSQPVQQLYCISSTRLRYEVQRPDSRITLYFGENDNFRPNNEWLNTMQANHHLIPNADHNLYTDISNAQAISSQILSEVSLSPE